jgi:hypothetical protein
MEYGIVWCIHVVSSPRCVFLFQLFISTSCLLKHLICYNWFHQDFKVVLSDLGRILAPKLRWFPDEMTTSLAEAIEGRPHAI